MATTTYNIGDVPVLSAAFTVGGVATDPTTVSLVVLSPDGSTATYTYAGGTVVKDSVGNYHVNLPALTMEGTFYWKWLATGAVADGEQGTFYCNPDLVTLFGSQRSNLCTVYDVREAMRLPATSTTSDIQIQRYVDLASSRIQSEFGHFQPAETGVTKRLRVGRNNRVRLFPYFLRSATTVILSPESFVYMLDPTVPDYVLEPVVTLEGAYTELRISPWKPVVSPTSMRFGYALVDITGDWGYATVPDAVRLAAVITVRAWMLRDAAAYSTTVQAMDPSIQPRPAGTYALPNAAREHLSLFAPTIGVA